MKSIFSRIRILMVQDTTFALVILSAVIAVLLFVAEQSPPFEIALSLLAVFACTAIVEFAHPRRD